MLDLEMRMHGMFVKKASKVSEVAKYKNEDVTCQKPRDSTKRHMSLVEKTQSVLYLRLNWKRSPP